jgi:hypothetical protein
MKGNRKLKLGDNEIYIALINKQLEKYGYTIETLPRDENGMVGGKMWYDYYTLTSHELETFKVWAWDYFKNNVTPKQKKSNFINILMLMLDSYGLTIKD